MRSARIFWLSLLAVAVACAIASASASAATVLPTLLFLAGETIEVTGEGKVTGAIGTVSLETEVGEELPGTGVVLKLGPSKNDTSLGPYTAEFKGVELVKEKKKCNNVGATKETGIVLVTGNEYHLVFVATGPGLAAGLLFLVKEFEFECGAAKVVAVGLALAKLTKNAAADVEVLGGVLGCTKFGKAELTTYLNDKGERVKAILKSNLGLGLETSCERTPELSLLFSHMITIDL